MAARDLTAERLRELVAYDQDTGRFTRRTSTGGRLAGTECGHINARDGYCQIRVDGAIYLAHRLAWLYVHGEWPRSEIDHINGIRVDNRIGNLRDVEACVNHQNLRRPMVTNRNGFLGVFRADKCIDRWQARIRVNGRLMTVGTFGSKQEAHAAYVKAKRRFHEGCTI